MKLGGCIIRVLCVLDRFQMVAQLEWLDEVKWTNDGLVPAIAQNAVTGQVLMMAWMNRDALEATITEGIAVYWSRSRAALWRKGERSGHQQIVREVRLDCDGDTILLKVEQVGGIACHTGRQHCFYRRFDAGVWTTVEPIVTPPEQIYAERGRGS